MSSQPITGLQDPTNAQDAATKNYIDTIFGSTTSAAASAAAAATSATNAANSATAANNSATAAANSATAAEAAYDSFDDRYLGPKASDPATDNDGNALVTGALYFNTTAGEMRVYNGSTWQAATTLGDAVVEQNFVATAGQTTAIFTAGYRVGLLYVYVNGVLLYPSDITATDGTNVTFANALNLNDQVRMVTFKSAGSIAVVDVSGLQAALDAKLNATNPVITGSITEDVYALAGTALDPANGTIQTKTLAANTTFTDSLAAGQSIVLMLGAGASYTVTWPTITWVTSGGNVAPTLTAADTLVFWKVSTTLYGAYVGSYV